jgi:hypothetical protein
MRNFFADSLQSFNLIFQVMKSSSVLFKSLVLLVVVLFLFPDSIVSQQQYDSEYKFSINIPSDWSSSSHKDGTDKVYDYYSPDQNAAIQLRVFETDSRVTNKLLAQLYEQNMLPAGYRKVSLSDYVSSNGIPGMKGVYEVNYNGNTVTLATFYTVQHDIGYVLTAIVPNTMIKQIGDEVKAITRTFRIDGFKAQSSTDKTGTTSSTIHAKFTSLVLDDAGVEFDIPDDFKLSDKKAGQSVWSNNDGKVKLVVQTIYKSTGKTVESLVEEIKQQVAGANGVIRKTKTVHIDNMTAKLISYEGQGYYFNYVYADGPVYLLAIGYVSPTSDKNTNNFYFNRLHSSLKKVQQNTGSTVSTSNSNHSSNIGGTYHFTGRSDNENAFNYWKITLNSDGTFVDQHQLKNDTYVSQNKGTWKVSDGNKLILTIPSNHGNDSKTEYSIENGGAKFVRHLYGGLELYFEK